MKLLIRIVLLFIPALLHAQENPYENILRALREAENDSTKFVASQAAAYYWVELNRDSLLHYVNECISLAQENSQELEEAWGYASRGYCFTGTGDYSEALTNFLKAFAIVEDPKYDDQLWLPPGESGRHHRLYYHSYTHHLYAILMGRVRNTEAAMHHFREARRIAKEINVPRGVIWANMNLAFYHLGLNELDSAYVLGTQAKELAFKTPGENKYLGMITSSLGMVSLNQKDTVTAKKLFREAINYSVANKNQMQLLQGFGNLSALFLNQGSKDSSLWYAQKAYEIIPTIGQSTASPNMGGIYSDLYKSYLLNDQPDSALKYAALAMEAMQYANSHEVTNLAAFQKMSLVEQQRLQNLEREKVVYQSRVRTYLLIAGLGVFLLIAGILYRNNKKTQASNKILEHTLTELKSTQTQLIQSEKMASLGELTAGIAHEIQNPLNFVNNFSEVSNELIEEMEDEIQKGNLSEAKSLAKDVKQNLEKILQHGKRADGIVKGMLQHSRNNSGQKELTDLNALCDEYLRLAYHGYRAKDKSFNAQFKIDFDPTLEKVSIVPQDIGRVVLNLINNAFYAVNEKGKQNLPGYEPTVTVSTKRISNHVEIKVADNGPGISNQIREKIFQPFFTTKPTGQGTGLGLSLSYDIVKAHGGELKVKTSADEGSEFIIHLPLS